MSRITILLYGVISYVIFFATFLYLIGFLGNIVVPVSVDGELRGTFATALFVNIGLIGLFAVQHSVMARPGFKKMWTKIIPEPAERATYVLLSSVALIVLFAFWRPMGGMVWDIQNVTGRTVMYGMFGFGWAMILYTTFLLNHFDLFGLRQVWLHFRGKPYTSLKFDEPTVYKHVRHPLYVGWLIAFWATPTMSVTHLLFAGGITVYILAAIKFEEKDLVDHFGPSYVAYREKVPMLIPFTKPKKVENELVKGTGIPTA